FRFVFAYCVMYVPVIVINSLPGMEGELDLMTKMCDPIILWVGKYVFGKEITIRPAGSGDTTWNYVQVFCFAVIAAAAMVIWSLIDFRRPSYPMLRRVLRFAIRY